MMYPWSLSACPSGIFPAPDSRPGVAHGFDCMTKLQISIGHWIRLEIFSRLSRATMRSATLAQLSKLSKLYYFLHHGARTPGGPPYPPEHVKSNGCSRDRMEPDLNPQTFTPCFPVPQSAKLHPKTILLRKLELTLFRKCNVGILALFFVVEPGEYVVLLRFTQSWASVLRFGSHAPQRKRVGPTTLLNKSFRIGCLS